jgi:hypothetical protein
MNHVCVCVWVSRVYVVWWRGLDARASSSRPSIPSPPTHRLALVFRSCARSLARWDNNTTTTSTSTTKNNEHNDDDNNIHKRSSLKIYVEHSNEVWNYGFSTFALNSAMAHWEVLNGTKRFPAGTSNLVAPVPGRPDLDADCSPSTASPNSLCWTQRLHARRVCVFVLSFCVSLGS